jgi:hypothetical protein
MGVIRRFIDTWSVPDIPFFTSAAKNRRNQVSWMLGAYSLRRWHPVVGIPPMPRCDLRRYGSWEARHQPLALWFICPVKRRLHLHPLECWVGRRMTWQRWGRFLDFNGMDADWHNKRGGQKSRSRFHSEPQCGNLRMRCRIDGRMIPTSCFAPGAGLTVVPKRPAKDLSIAAFLRPSTNALSQIAADQRRGAYVPATDPGAGLK